MVEKMPELPPLSDEEKALAENILRLLYDDSRPWRQLLPTEHGPAPIPVANDADRTDLFDPLDEHLDN